MYTPEPLWSKTVTLSSGETREWDGVITESVNQQFVVRLTEPFETELNQGFGEHEREALLEDRMWIHPGSDSAPDVADLRAAVETTEVDPKFGEPQPVKQIDITYDGMPTETAELDS
jgi:hypothetical protein